MPKPPNIDRPVRLEISVPESLRAWLEIHLWSDSEGRVPHAAYSKLFVELLRQYKTEIEDRKERLADRFS